jgi:hypothetical protein
MQILSRSTFILTKKRNKTGRGKKYQDRTEAGMLFLGKVAKINL